MSITFGDNLKHNNPNYPIADITDIKGGLRSIATFSDASLLSEFTTGTGGTPIPEKYKTGYSLMLERSTGTIYYLSGISATNSSNWTRSGGNVDGTGITNSIAKWIGSTSLGNSNITDNGDTVTINGNLMVIGTTSTISSENLLVKDPIILLAGSQSGTPTYDAGLFINRGSSDTQAFIWDESMNEFKFITTTSGATTSGNVSIGTYSNVRTGPLSIGTGTTSNSRFTVSSSSGTVSLIVDENGYVYNRGRGGTATNTAFGFMTLGANTTGGRNTAFGASALSVNTTGQYNTGIGHQSLMSNISGSNNTGIGLQSLNQNISGSNNIAIGSDSLRYNRNSNNTAIGHQSLSINTIGSSNTAVGSNALLTNTSEMNTFGTITPGSGYLPGTYLGRQLIYATGSVAVSYPKVDIIVDGSGAVTSVTLGTNLGSGFPDLTTRMTISNSFLGGLGSGFEVGIAPTTPGVNGLLTGINNTAVGSNALLSNTSGSNNTAVGQGSLDSSVKGTDNVAVGQGSLQTNSTGSYNTAVGRYSMYYNTTGDWNIGIGWQALPNNTTGYQNTGIGRNSLFNSRTGLYNTAVGDAALYYNTSGNYHTGLGLEAGHRSTTGVSVLGTFSSGNGYTPGTYSGVQLKYSSGPQVSGVAPDFSIDYYPIATIVVGTGGTISSVTLETSGRTFATSSTIMTSNIYPLSIVDGGPGYTASSTFSNVQLLYISGGTATTYPVVTVYTDSAGIVSSVTIVTNGSGFQDNTTIMGANLGTGTFSVKAAPNSIGPGTGFTVRIESIQTAQSNTAVGFKSLYQNTIGSNNVSFGHEAGSYTNTDPYFNHISNNSVYIGYFARAKSSNETNQIVIGYEATGNGSNTVTLGNDSIVKTYLKGKVVIADGTQGPGKVLISDASGESSWANISFGGGGSTSSFYIKGTSTYSYDTTSDIFRTGAILIGSGSVDTNDRFVVSSITGPVSLVVDNNGNVYNKSRGISNTIFGYQALSNTTGTDNVAIGRRSLNSATSSSYNTAIGNDSLYTNTTGTQNTALGFQSLYSNTIGSFNVAFGIDSLFNNNAGDSNTALGWKSLYNTNSSYNTAIGWQALYGNTIGTGSVAIGYDAGTNFTNGTGATNSNNSIFIGASTKPQLDGQSNQIVIGHGATGNGSNTVTLGNNSITNTYLKGNVQTNGTMTATGFFNSSDARLKDIVERDGDTIKFTWKDKRDDKVHIGYIAQEVQEKYPDQVNENSDGMLTVNYIEVLVAKIQELENRIKQLEK